MGGFLLLGLMFFVFLGLRERCFRCHLMSAVCWHFLVEWLALAGVIILVGLFLFLSIHATLRGCRGGL